MVKLVAIAIERVHDATGDDTLAPSLAHGAKVATRRAIVQEERQPALLRECELQLEACALDGAGAEEEAVVVETALAHSHDEPIGRAR